MDPPISEPQQLLESQPHPDVAEYDLEEDVLMESNDGQEQDSQLKDEAQLSNTRKKGKKESSPWNAARAPGKTHFPISRVQKILKADRELFRVEKEATFLLAVAAEEFAKRFGEAAEHTIKGKGRTTIQLRDVSSLTRRASEYIFLDELYRWIEMEAQTQRVAKPLPQKKTKKTPTAKGPLDNFVAKEAATGGDDEEEDADSAPNIVMNEDGTMSVDA